jgi:hypothetical protein
MAPGLAFVPPLKSIARRRSPREHRLVPALLSPALADAHDTNYADFSTGYARHAGSDLRRDSALDRAIIDLPALPFNGVFRSNLAETDVAGVAAETIAVAGDTDDAAAHRGCSGSTRLAR